MSASRAASSADANSSTSPSTATEGLAPLIVREILRIIGDIRGTGIASLIVDRNFRTVLTNTDRAIILEKGRAVLDDRSEVLSSQPEELAARLGV